MAHDVWEPLAVLVAEASYPSLPRDPETPVPVVPPREAWTITEDHLQERGGRQLLSHLQGQPIGFNIDLLLHDLYGMNSTQLIEVWLGKEAATALGFDTKQPVGSSAHESRSGELGNPDITWPVSSSAALYLRRFMSTLRGACPSWDARLVRAAGRDAVAITVYPQAFAVYFVEGGEWWTFMTMDVADLAPAEDGAKAMRVSDFQPEAAAASAIHSQVTAYKDMLSRQEDPIYESWREAAEVALGYLAPALDTGGAQWGASSRRVASPSRPRVRCPSCGLVQDARDSPWQCGCGQRLRLPVQPAAGHPV